MLKFVSGYLLLFIFSFFISEKPSMSNVISNDISITCLTEDMNMISIYPNPLTGDEMFLKAPRNTGFIILHDKEGKKVFRQEFKKGTNEYNISRVEPGTYDVSIITDGSVSVAKFEICRW